MCGRTIERTWKNCLSVRILIQRGLGTFVTFNAEATIWDEAVENSAMLLTPTVRYCVDAQFPGAEWAWSIEQRVNCGYWALMNHIQVLTPQFLNYCRGLVLLQSQRLCFACQELFNLYTGQRPVWPCGCAIERVSAWACHTWRVQTGSEVPSGAAGK